jgi:Ca-activated chloride channel family protein
VLPKPSCPNDVCLHGLFGEMGNMITGSDCITVLVGMNTAIDISKLERPPLNLAPRHRHQRLDGGRADRLRARRPDAHARRPRGQGPHLAVTFSSGAHVQVEAVTGDAPELINAIDAIAANGGTNIYDGLRTGFEVVDAHRIEGAQNRVVFLSDGMATDGITNDAKIISMAAGFAAQGYGLTTIGVGTSFDAELMRSLSEQASGNFYFLQDPAAVQEVFHEEVTSFLVPLAEDVSIDVDIGDAYVLRGIYGTKLFDIAAGAGSIEIPNLQLAHRTGVDDHEDGGRRGGGGAILLELLRKKGQAPTQDVGDLKLHYRRPQHRHLRRRGGPDPDPRRARPGRPRAGHLRGHQRPEGLRDAQHLHRLPDGRDPGRPGRPHRRPPRPRRPRARTSTPGWPRTPTSTSRTTSSTSGCSRPTS